MVGEGIAEQELQAVIAGAIKAYGVAETARRLGMKSEQTLRLVVPGANPHKGTIALARANLHLLQGA